MKCKSEPIRMFLLKPISSSVVYAKSSTRASIHHWMPRGFVSFSRRYIYRQRPTRYNSRSLALFTLAFLASTCLVYHFNTFKYGISKAFEKCIDRQKENNREDASGIENMNGIEISGIGSLNSKNNIGLQRRLPQCLIIGVRKGGTRALLDYLAIHPAVKTATDEVHYFDDDTKYYLGLEWYRRQMPFSSTQHVTIEKSPAYFVTDNVPQRVHSMNSTIKLIIIVRDPVTRLISDYAQLAANKVRKDRKMPSFEESVLLPDGRVDMSYKAVKTSMYAYFYTKWTKVFPSHQIHIVDGDRLVYEPFPEVQKVEQFLHLSHAINPDNFSYNSTKGFFCVRLNATIERCLNESKGRRHPLINPLVVQALRRFYAPYNRHFYKLVGRDFGWPEI